jgi:hypothetical protein
MSMFGGQLPTTPRLADVVSMSSEPSTALAPDAEIHVALAEAEAQAAEIPSLEAGAAPKVVHIPVEGPPLPRAQAAPPAAEVAPVAAAPEPPVAVDPPPAKYRVFTGAIDGLLALATLVTSLLMLLLLPASR